MAREEEIKLWFKRPSPEVIDVLGLGKVDASEGWVLDQLAREISAERRLTDSGELEKEALELFRKKAREIAGVDEPELDHLVDNWYLRTRQTSYTVENLGSRLRFEKSSGSKGIIWYDDKPLNVSLAVGDGIERNYDDFMFLLIESLSHSGMDNNNGVRFRNLDNGVYTMTMKRKNNQGDLDNDEYKFVVDMTEALDFLKSLGFTPQENERKEKDREVYRWDSGETIYKIEVNGVKLCKGRRQLWFVEIEAVSPSDSPPRIEEVYEIARRLGIKEPTKGVADGGAYEERGYRKLQRILNEAAAVIP